MELRDIFRVDVDSLSPTQAEMVSRDIVDALVNGKLIGADRERLKPMLVDVRRKVLGDATRDVRADILQHIKAAEARGDKRTANLLADGMMKSDVAAVEREERAKKAAEAAEKHWADEKAANGAQHERLLQKHIDERVQELLNIYGSSLSEDKCRKIADKEVRQKLANIG